MNKNSKIVKSGRPKKDNIELIDNKDISPNCPTEEKIELTVSEFEKLKNICEQTDLMNKQLLSQLRQVNKVDIMLAVLNTKMLNETDTNSLIEEIMTSLGYRGQKS